MQLQAKEQFAHVLMQQMPQAAYVKILGFKLVNKTAKNASLPPLEDGYLQVLILFALLQANYLHLLILNLSLHLLCRRLMISLHSINLFLQKLFTVLAQDLLLLLKKVRLTPLLGIELVS